MKSAYLTLGLPGNATREDIQAAYDAAMTFFTKERLVADPSLLGRRDQVMEAYKVLSNSDLRAAHDRKLAAASQVAASLPVTTVQGEPTLFRKLLPLLVVCAVVFGAGQWMVNKREAQRLHALALEQEAKQLEAQKAAAEVAQRTQEVAEQRRKAQEDEARERQSRREAQYAGQQTQYIVNQQLQYQRQLTQEEERARQRTKQDDAARQRESESTAQRQQSRDQSQLRNLCIINYGRPNC